MTTGSLPNSWILSSIGEITSYVQRGKGPKYAKQPNDFPVINQKAIRWHGIESEHLKYVDESQWDKWDEVRFVKEGDILWNSTGTGTIGRACYLSDLEAKKAKVVDSHVTIVRSSPLILSKIVFYWIMHPEIQSKVGGLYTGTTNQVELSKTMVLGTEFPLPPLAEQKQIAAKLDELLAQVDTLKTRLDAIPAILKRFRQSVLAAAVSGRLTEEWRGNQDCEKFAVGQESISIPCGWKKMVLGDVISQDRKLCYGVVQPGDNVDTGVDLIRVCDIRDGVIDWSSLRKVSIEIDHDYRRSRVSQGDILVTIVGAIGRVGIVDRDTNANIARAIARVAVDESLSIPMYIHAWLSSPVLQWWLVNSSKEVARKTLNLKELKEAPVAIPHLNEQIKIVRRIEQLFTFANQIEQRVKDAQSRVNHLTQSILAKAFRGELTAEWREQNPDLISGENSAEALLNRIKAQRQTAPLKTRTRKKRA
ncbi:MAG: restriction endonuclease subunit S [Candidatus Thiodiazotropha taylori]